MVQDVRSAFKLAQLQALPKTSDIQTIQKILGQEGDINFAIPVDSPRSDVVGYTALHFACMKANINLFKNLLNHGADFTKINGNGHTVLHMLFEKKTVEQLLDNPFIDSVFQTHVISKNFLNPCNNDGLSHFHIACVTNNTAAVQFFIENGVSIDESVSRDSKIFPGYTPLHFAAISTNTKIAELLLEHGADIHVTDARKMTPLHVLIKRKLEMYDSVGTSMRLKDDSYKKLQKQIEENDKIINMLLENMSISIDCPDTIGLSNFHVACMLQDKSIAQQLVDRVTDLDHRLGMNSPLWSGYTALHFAAHVSIDTVQILMSYGANLASKTLNGLTPLDICIERYKIEDVCDIMFLNESWRNILFSDGKTKILSLIRTFVDENYFKKFLTRSIKDINMRIPMESALWPGYTPLHLVVLFAGTSKKMCHENEETTEQEIVKLCLKNKADLSVQDNQGRTALHLAFRLGKMKIVDVIIQHCSEIPNVSDNENLSHLHIGCVACISTNSFKKCVLDGEVVNAVYRGTSVVNEIRPGSTPLHACLLSRSDLHYKVKVLLESGANPYVKDVSGLTATHRLLERSTRYWSVKADTNPLLTKVSNDCVAEEYGLSHLHVACELNNRTAVKRFIKNGVNVNLAIKYPQQNEDDSLEFLSRYDKCTPLHMTRGHDSFVKEHLFKRGADLFAKKVDGSTPLNDPKILPLFMSKIKKNVDLQNRMRREFGWTRLHLACHWLEVDGFENMVKVELADVNAQVFLDSPVWKGYTPLHLLMHHASSYASSAGAKAYDASKILLENGADVTLIACTDDKQQNTPISMLLRHSAASEQTYKQAVLLMKYYSNFNVNPVIPRGMSHFHLACYLNNVDAVEEFLLHGADVNHLIDFFSDWRPGHTPLHLTSQLHVVDLLISRGADIYKQDAHGCSVLTEVLCRDVLDEKILLKLIESGANANGLNFSGQTPFEIVISKGPISMEKLTFCIEQDFLVNSCNSISGIGYVAMILDTDYKDTSLQMRIVETIINETSATILGRTTFHHIVSGTESNIYDDNYMILFEKLIKSGVDINEQDDRGKTALHLAVEFLNRQAVYGLLRAGADLNCLDINGKTALSYVASNQSTFSCYDHDRIRSILIEHICKLDLFKLDLIEFNATAIVGKSIHSYCNELFSQQIAKCRNIKIGVRSLRLYDFLSETGAVMLYPSLNQSERETIDRYFVSYNDFNDLKQIQGLLNLQYRKAVKRVELLSYASDSFRSLLGFDLPYLCTENIFQYLCNSALKNIIHAETKNEYMQMETKNFHILY